MSFEPSQATKSVILSNNNLIVSSQCVVPFQMLLAWVIILQHQFIKLDIHYFVLQQSFAFSVIMTMSLSNLGYFLDAISYCWPKSICLQRSLAPRLLLNWRQWINFPIPWLFFNVHLVFFKKRQCIILWTPPFLFTLLFTLHSIFSKKKVPIYKLVFVFCTII